MSAPIDDRAAPEALHGSYEADLEAHADRQPGSGLGAGFWIAAGWVGLVVVAAILGDLVPGIQDPLSQDYANVAATPGGEYLLGTDWIGRDMLSRTVYGARTSLIVGLLAVLFGMLVGGTLGLVAGYIRGRVEKAIMILTDVVLAFPTLILLLSLAVVFGASLRVLIIGLGIASVPTFIRLSRANTLRFAQREFVLAAKSMGARPGRVILREILPNVILPVGAYSVLILAVMIVAEGSLSFLGVGVPPPSPSWGNMIAGGRPELADSPHMVFVPAMMLFATVLALNLAGDRLRALTDAKTSSL